MDIKIHRAIERWSGELSGVFTMADLRVVLVRDQRAEVRGAWGQGIPTL